MEQRAAVAAACGGHVLFSKELLEEWTSQAWMSLSQQSAKARRDRWRESDCRVRYGYHDLQSH